MNNFSIQSGLTERVLQRNQMNESLKNRLWNIIYSTLETNIIPEISGYNDPEWSKPIFPLIKSLWTSFFLIDSLPNDPYQYIKKIKIKYFNLTWNETYDLLEFFANHLINKKSFIDECNIILKEENSAYRFIGPSITEITSEIEIDSIENSQRTAYWQVNEHINKALKFLSDNKAPDFKNSIKESISAVEAIVKIISKSENGTLGVLVTDPKLNLPSTIQDAIKKIYGFASNAGGIRHSNKNDKNASPTKADALFILTTCSAITNYIIQISEL
ncbi:MAG: hypothetical protein Q8M40_01250 [Legionella sp.]|nr:hypothetical protein [Legionella sp.]